MVTVIGSGLESYVARRTRKQAMNLIAEAEHEAAELVAQAAEAAEQLHGGAEADARERVGAMRRRLAARAEMEAREELLLEQERVLERVWRVAAERLASLDATSQPDERLARLRALTMEAALQLSGGVLSLQVNARDAALLTDDLLAAWSRQWQSRLPGLALVLADEPATIAGGVIVRAEGGHAIVDNSYERRLAVAREALRGPVMGILAASAVGEA